MFVEAAAVRSTRLLSGARELRGRIHVWRLFSLFDGMGMPPRSGPVVMLNANALYGATDASIRILTAHEIHHAVRAALLGTPSDRGILDSTAGESLVFISSAP